MGVNKPTLNSAVWRSYHYSITASQDEESYNIFWFVSRKPYHRLLYPTVSHVKFPDLSVHTSLYFDSQGPFILFGYYEGHASFYFVQVMLHANEHLFNFIRNLLKQMVWWTRVVHVLSFIADLVLGFTFLPTSKTN